MLLQPLPRPPVAWHSLCATAVAGDALTATKRALAWRHHRVPDVEGAAGFVCSDNCDVADCIDMSMS